jgi:hypothetical protein
MAVYAIVLTIDFLRAVLITHLGSSHSEANKTRSARKPKSHLLGSLPRQTATRDGFQLPNPETASLSLTPFSISLMVLSYRPTRPQACNERVPSQPCKYLILSVRMCALKWT